MGKSAVLYRYTLKASAEAIINHGAIHQYQKDYSMTKHTKLRLDLNPDDPADEELNMVVDQRSRRRRSGWLLRDIQMGSKYISKI